MSKERLEEIKTKGGIGNLDLDWLIKQAELVERLAQRNKRYREAIEKAIDYLKSTENQIPENELPPVYENVLNILNQEVEEEKE